MRNEDGRTAGETTFRRPSSPSLGVLFWCAIVGLSNANAAAPEKMRLIRFPSKRAITVPALAGRFEAVGNESFDSLSYTEITIERGFVYAVVMTTTSRSISCNDSRSALHALEVFEHHVDVPSEPMNSLGVAWYVSYPIDKNTRRVRHACLARKKGSIEVTIDEPVGLAGWPELEPIAVAMLAVRK